MMTDKNTKNEIYQEYTILLKRAADDSIEVPDDIYGLTIRDTKAVLLEAVEHISRLINKSDEKRNNQNENEFFQTSDQAEQNKNNSSNDNYHSSKDYNQESEYKQAGVMSTSSVRAGAKVQYFSLGNSLGIIAPEIIDKIKAVEDIVNLRRAEIQKLEQLENRLYNCVEKINNDRLKYYDTVSRNEANINERKNAIDMELKEVEAENEQNVVNANGRLEKLKADIEEKKALRNKTREKENEQYEYEISILMAREDDAWEDKLSKKELTLKALGNEIAELKAELSEKEKNVESLKEKLDKLPELIENAKKQGALLKRKEMEEDNNHKAELLKRESASELATLNSMIDNLENDYEEKIKERDNLRVKLDKAYEESNKLYLQTVQSTGGIKILGGSEQK